MRRLIRIIAPAAIVLALGAAVAQACPMCNQSIAEEDHLPRAFMYSILFMLGMPATVFSGFGLALFLKFQQHAAGQARAEHPIEQFESPAPAGAAEPVGA